MCILLSNSKPKNECYEKKLQIFYSFVHGKYFFNSCLCSKYHYKWKCKKNSSGDDVPAVSVTIKGGNAGTYTDDKGNFKLTSDTTSATNIAYFFNRVRVAGGYSK